MSNRLFQGLVHQMRDTIDATIGVVDETATIIACSDLTRVGTTNEFVSLDLSDSHDIFIRDGFNAEMDAVRDRLLAEYASLRSDAVYGYAASGEEDWNRPALLQLSVSDARCTERLYSSLCLGSADYSGAHPARFARAWSYDLAEGRFVQWYDLASDPDALRAALTDAVVAQARESGMDKRFYDGWEAAAQSMDGCAVYLGAEGITLVYPQYALGGHAAGLPAFTVPYDAVKQHLSSYGRALIAE